MTDTPTPAELRALTERLRATHRDGNHLYGPDQLSVEAAAALDAQAARIGALEAALGEAAAMFREYEKHHLARADECNPDDAIGMLAAMRKAFRNGEIATRIEALHHQDKETTG
jgi:hypothetical protein